MGFTNSALVDCKVMSPNHSGTRTDNVDRITPHCVVGQLTAEGIGYCFNKGNEGASCNYGIGTEGRVCLIVDEENRSWCTSSRANDQRAITIECACDKTHPYAFNDNVYNKLIELCVDICKRNGKTKLLWIADKERSLNYNLASDEMLITVHRWFANKSCPGDWLYERLGDLAAKVTTQLNSVVEPPKEETKEEVKEEIKYFVQVGAYSRLDNAKKLVAELKAAGFNAIIKTGKGDVVEKKWEPNIGDTVKFTGYQQFSSSTSNVAHGALVGVAKITAIAKGKKHPYHLIRIGSTGPYGWVDEGTFTKV